MGDSARAAIARAASVQPPDLVLCAEMRIWIDPSVKTPFGIGFDFPDKTI
jgi:hypothetical protein